MKGLALILALTGCPESQEAVSDTSSTEYDALTAYISAEVEAQCVQEYPTTDTSSPIDDVLVNCLEVEAQEEAVTERIEEESTVDTLPEYDPLTHTCSDHTNLSRAEFLHELLDKGRKNFDCVTLSYAGVMGGHYIVDLKDQELQGLSFRGANIVADLTDANLQRANLEGAYIGVLGQGSTVRTDLRHANLDHATISVVLRGTKLYRASLVSAVIGAIEPHIDMSNLRHPFEDPRHQLNGRFCYPQDIIGYHCSIPDSLEQTPTTLRHADLTDALIFYIIGANMGYANLSGATIGEISDSYMGSTIWHDSTVQEHMLDSDFTDADFSQAYSVPIDPLAYEGSVFYGAQLSKPMHTTISRVKEEILRRDAKRERSQQPLNVICSLKKNAPEPDGLMGPINWYPTYCDRFLVSERSTLLSTGTFENDQCLCYEKPVCLVIDSK